METRVKALSSQVAHVLGPKKNRESHEAPKTKASQPWLPQSPEDELGGPGHLTSPELKV